MYFYSIYKNLPFPHFLGQILMIQRIFLQRILKKTKTEEWNPYRKVKGLRPPLHHYFKKQSRMQPTLKITRIKAKFCREEQEFEYPSMPLYLRHKKLMSAKLAIVSMIILQNELYRKITS